jgi:uncharacterized protein
MRTETHTLPSATPGTRQELISLHYGQPGTGPKVYLQAALHADEVPGMLVAYHLRQRLAALEAEGRVTGEIVLVPAANPLGLAQWLLRAPQGRFDAVSGENFNRQFADLAPTVVARCGPELGGDAAANQARVRAALREAAGALNAVTPLEVLRRTLLTLAIDADVVLDLHCDGEALLHLYTTPGTWAAEGELLARCIGSEVALLAEHSGGEPFDEACSMVWPDIAARLPAGVPLPNGCMAATIELRGEHDVDHALARRDAEALLVYLHHRGALKLDPAPALPDLKRPPTPLAGSIPMHAPHGGVLAFLRDIGSQVQAGDVVAEVIDPLNGLATPIAAPVAGLFFARDCKRFAHAGMALGKVAGTQALREGALLSA